MKYPHLTKEPTSELEWFQALVDLARYLRGPDGCPWDRQQTSQDFAGFSVEEAQEFVEAAASGDDDHMAEELGDALFCLLAAAAAAEEEGRFKLEGVLRGIHEKMIRRHEHVFGDVKAKTAADAVDSWNRVKAEEKGEG